jgi:hypothetical protein
MVMARQARPAFLARRERSGQRARLRSTMPHRSLLPLIAGSELGIYGEGPRH